MQCSEEARDLWRMEGVGPLLMKTPGDDHCHPLKSFGGSKCVPFLSKCFGHVEEL